MFLLVIFNKKLGRMLLVAGFLTGVLIVLSTTLWNITVMTSTTGPIYQGSTDKRAVAIAINVDWGEKYLPQLLDILEKGNSKVTFFVTGRWASKFPALVKEMDKKGHEVGNHGYSHSHPDRLSKEENRQEILKAEKVLMQITGKKPKLFAPPYGEKGKHVVEAASELGYFTIMWTIDTIDWKEGRRSSQIIEKVLSKLENGAIILMHPTTVTVEALPVILRSLNEKGYNIVPVSQIIN
ncbi:polysaccharide deacetylase family protein [Calderihabitans maritimus]|uniref:Polysaccharide deacetylase n=1 Tax=Calderihabitans maritimus TaxID=1246530 RepID=A0A1Z5HQB5_9FIRM|nr:polysaccharide deacetylase family protein [Calderihabitans maritimus]GAW91726.1 polysaccharide deacetylase [Calderihabitans maritimus]